MSTFAERLKEARERAGFESQADLARAIGVSAGTIGNYEAGTRKMPRDIVTIAKALDVSPEWLAGHTIVRRNYDKIISELAQDMSYARPTLGLLRITWETLMTADLQQPFELEVIDDALAPEIFKGCIARLDPHRKPEAGWPALVRDKDGRHYLRDYQQGPGGAWQAVARTRGYTPMDSIIDGLTVVAVLKGYDRP